MHPLLDLRSYRSLVWSMLSVPSRLKTMSAATVLLLCALPHVCHKEGLSKLMLAAHRARRW